MFKDNWEAQLDNLLARATNRNYQAVLKFTEVQCRSRIKLINAMTARRDYSAIMTEGPAEKLYEEERKLIPAC
ncbi:MAG: hypothetical protein HQ503_15090 [Rhodospirillales bacterium]|nr:hypothetical protein [Rhodospirillales bacterium]